MANYTPLNISLLLRETGDIDPRFARRKKGSFDKVFFPFSIMVLVLSLSFYAVKLMVDITTVPTQASQQKLNPEDIMDEVVVRPTLTPSPTKTVEKMYSEIGSIILDSERIQTTSKDFYPDLDEAETIRTVKNSLLQWAALRKYYENDPLVSKRLTIDTSYPIATYGAILKDLDTLKRSFYANKADWSDSDMDNLIVEYEKNTTIKLEP